MACTIVVQGIGPNNAEAFSFLEVPTPSTLLLSVAERLGIEKCKIASFSETVYFLHEGQLLTEGSLDGCFFTTVQCCFRILGGKQGAFGQTVRNAKTTGKKIVSMSKCRDLSGRRIGDLKVEKMLKEWSAKAPEREAAKRLEMEKKNARRLAPMSAPDLGKYDEKLKSSSEGLLDAMGFALKHSDSRNKKHAQESDSESDESESMDEDDLSSSEENEDESSESDVSESQHQKQPKFDSESEGETKETLLPFLKEKKKNDSFQSNTSPQCSSSISSPPSTISSLSSPSDSSDKSSSVEDSSSNPAQPAFQPISLDCISSSSELIEKYSREQIKSELNRLGLKCGGRIEELAERLFSIKGIETQKEKWNPKILVKV
ncbi:putative Silencing defective 2 N-terminal ubiquitin domain [Monocercomonoides exilis]|uniref:putative Silencing defective 2 N-terminal ubiquitin domain n=1 Tax=Monocercomonoides exilis TaxID=2049356 RepID=UPI003559D956|nr:putative Silencing defective 2 N-terminal ubiquitin domain [Monocercomonoides exilis]